jgi:tetratricopeptide (TPR) repeat protein
MTRKPRRRHDKLRRKNRRSGAGPGRAGGDRASSDVLGRAVVLHQSGRPRDALRVYRQILGVEPKHPEALEFAAAAAFEAEDFQQAADWLRILVEIAPCHAPALDNLGAALQQLKRFDEAVATHRRALEIRADNPVTHFNLGNALRKLKKFDQAAAAYRQGLEFRPDDAEALYWLGRALNELEKHDEAVASYRRSLEIRPDDADTCFYLGSVLWTQKKFSGAETAYRRVLASQPDNEDVLFCLGCCLQEQGKLDAAVKTYRKAVEIEPGYAKAYYNIGCVLTMMGKPGEAEAAFRRALEIQPGYAKVYFGLALIRTLKARDADITAMESLLASPPAADEEEEASRLCFALAMAYEDKGDYERAFQHFEKGNRLKRSSIQYDAGDGEKVAERVIKVFNKVFLDSRAGHGCPSDEPIFILGVPRSGTSLIEQILASHSHVFGAGELQEFRSFARRMRQTSNVGQGFPEAARNLGPKALRCFGDSYLTSLRRRAPEARRFTDKLPGNYLYIGLIRMVFPNARIIHSVRDPVDTCLACYRMSFQREMNFAYDLVDLGRFYRAYARLMRHWRDISPGRILDVRYEDMVADQEHQTRRLLEFCGLPWEDGCLSFHKTDRPVLTASASQVRQPIYKSAVNRWKRYESHLAPLLKALGPLV